MCAKPNKKQPQELSIPIINQNAAGIDVGDMLLWVAVPADRDDCPVRDLNPSLKTSMLLQIG